MNEQIVAEAEVSLRNAVAQLMAVVREIKPSTGYVSIDVECSSSIFQERRQPDEVKINLWLSPELGKGKFIEGDTMVDKINKLAKHVS